MDAARTLDEHLPAVAETLRTRGALVVTAPPGAGKTTRIPPALLEAGLVPRSLVLLQPRRVAARAAARWMAEENGWVLGREVGYQVRFEKRLARDTRIQIVTEGVLSRRLQTDPFLEGVDLVVLDEFHLRSLEGDLCLAFLRELRRSLRPELRLLVLSATLCAAPVAAFLDCPAFELPGRAFPVEIHYAEKVSNEPVARRAARAARQALAECGRGHVLVFLPGAREIREAASLLSDLPRVLPLHGSLPAEDQDRAVRPGADRAVILATNVAETSLTIPGVAAVVDGGLQRLLCHDPSRGLDRLETVWIARDAAEQRAGRAGRTGPGRVWRLWTRSQDRGLAAATRPEIARVDLAGAVLALRGLGVEPRTLGWLEPPPEAALVAAERLLAGLGALDAENRITGVGRRLLELPLHPRLGRLLLEARRRGLERDGAALAALLAERDLLGGAHAGTEGPSDLLLRLDLLRRAEEGTPDPAVDRAALAQVRAAAAELGRAGRGEAPREELLRLIHAAYPDRVARRRAPGSDRAVMAGGRGVVLGRESGVREGLWFAALVLDDAGPDALVRQASLVREEWLETREETTLAFNDTEERVIARRRWLHQDLLVREAPIAPDPDQAARLLAEAAARDALAALAPSAAARALLARAACLREWRPELGLPDLREALAELLPELCRGCLSFADLRRRDLSSALRGLLGGAGLAALDQLAPERIEVPSGALLPLVYEPGRPPVLAVQLQHLFGLGEGPKVAGRVPVLLELLSPAGRPVQVTQDLRSFWNETYPRIRGGLRARYPRHSWPEDPWSAPPTGRPRRV